MKEIWKSITGWVANNAFFVWLGSIVLIVIGWEKIKADIKKEAKKAERSAIAQKQAEVRVRVTERSTEIINEERQHADQALEARDDSRPAPPFDQLPDEVQRVLNRSARGHQAS